MADDNDGRGYPEPRFDIPTSRATSRRTFIKGVIASGAAVSSAGYLFTLAGCSREQGAARGIERMLQLKVNGQVRTVDVLPNETLAMTLRYKLGLTGTKLGCDRGECGACTVLVGELHPVQQAMIDELGPQCGFCTPGQIMSAVALLKANPKPTRDEARHALAGNLCRCGAYDHYLNAVMRAAGSGENVSRA
jgi:aerobic-type carbon monoxide dehydrogenase small subunit (CoxS/CutS family)